MILAVDSDAMLGYVCCGAILLVVLIIVGVVGGSKKAKKSKGRKKKTKLDALEESHDRNQRIIEDAYHKFDRLTADEIRGLSKQLGKDLIGEPPKAEREALKALASAKRLQTATTLKQIISIRGDVEAGLMDYGGEKEFLAALDAKLVKRIDAMLTERWNTLEGRAAKKITDKVVTAWETFAAELDECCQGGIWSSNGPIPELIWSWHDKVQERASEVEEQLPE